MREYHKIHSLYLRDPATRSKTFLEGQFARPEFEYLSYVPWVFTEKVDGTNIRVGFESNVADRDPNRAPYGVKYGGRTDDAQVPSQLFAHLLETFSLDKMVAAFPDLKGEVTIFGEGYGAKIQKGGGRYRPDAGLIIFDVVVGDTWLERHNVEDVAAKLGVPSVPVVGEGTVHDAVEFVKAGFKSRCSVDPTLDAEGIVFRPKVDLFDRRGDRIISKLKAKDFVAG